jgi:hypothetical protein
MHRLRVFENKRLRRIFGPKKEKIKGGSRKLHYEEHHNFCCSPYIIRVMKSMRIRLAKHVASRG